MRNEAQTRMQSWIDEYLNTYTILILLFTTIFIVPFFARPVQEVMYQVLIFGIFFAVIFLTRHHRWIVFSVVIAALMLKHLLAPAIGVYELSILSEGLNILVFAFGVSQLIAEVARNKEVDLKVILDAVNGYLLLGLAFATIFAFIHTNDPDAYNFPEKAMMTMSDYNYFGFVTLSTLGYGDITPQSSVARSLAVLASVAGQLYVAVIVALLVGKFAAKQD